MHSFLRLRYESVLSTADTSIMESMVFRGLSYDFRDRFETSASSPSLRASEPATTAGYSTMANGNDADGAGNVKVVVRVRQFVQRGKNSFRPMLN